MMSIFQPVSFAASLTFCPFFPIDIISSTEYEKEKQEREQDIKAAIAEEAAAQREHDEASVSVTKEGESGADSGNEEVREDSGSEVSEPQSASS